MSHPVYTLTCERCRNSFVTQSRKQRTCGYSCRDDGRRKIHPQRLQSLVATGMKRRLMAAELGVREYSVFQALHRYGLYSTWREKRSAA